MIFDRLRLRTALFMSVAIFAFTLLQNGDAQEKKAVVKGEYEETRANLRNVKTLDQVRELSEKPAVAVGVELPNFREDVSVFSAPRNTPVIVEGVATVHDPRRTVMARIGEIKKNLSSAKGASEKDQAELEAALTDYFIADMQHRVRELDKIKAEIAETEAKLQKRLDSQEEVVDLQLKLMLAEADGLGFFPKSGEAQRRSNPGSRVAAPGVRTRSVIGLPLPLGASKGR